MEHQTVLDPHVQWAIFLIGIAIVFALICWVLVMLDHAFPPDDGDDSNDNHPTLN